MSQGEFTKDEADAAEGAFTEIFKALSKAKQAEFLGQANNIYLFLSAAKEVATEIERAKPIRRPRRRRW